MKRVVLLGIALVFGLTVAPTLFVEGASAHLCGSGSSCHGDNCEDDGSAHVHNDEDGNTCWALPSPECDDFPNCLLPI